MDACEKPLKLGDWVVPSDAAIARVPNWARLVGQIGGYIGLSGHHVDWYYGQDMPAGRNLWFQEELKRITTPTQEEIALWRLAQIR